MSEWVDVPMDDEWSDVPMPTKNPPVLAKTAPPQPGAIDRLFGKWGNRSQAIQDMVSRQTSGSIPQSINNAPTMAALTAGQLVGGVNDAIGEGIGSAFGAIVPQSAKDALGRGLGYVAQTPVGKAIGTAASGVSGAYGSFKNAYPDAAMAAEGAGNILSLGWGGKAAQATGKEAGNTAYDIGRVVSKPFSNPAGKLKKVVTEGYTSGVRPTVVGKGTASRAGAASNRAVSAVEEIVNNKAALSFVDDAGEVVAGELPKNMGQFSQAIEQAKKGLRETYHGMAVEAGDSGAKFSSSKIIKELDNAAGDLKHNPQVRAYAKSLMDDVAELHGQAPDIIEARITDLNNSLSGFYDGRVSKAKAQVDGSVAALMRKELDDGITEALGRSGYQEAKKRYGSLLSIEKEVNQRAIVSARQNRKGLADLTDIFTGGQIVSGAARMAGGDPSGVKNVIAGVAGKFIKGKIKDANNADNIIKKMFIDADKVIERSKPFEPRSLIGKQLFKKGPERPASLLQIPQLEPAKQIPYYPRPTIKPHSGPLALPGPQGFIMYSPEELAQMRAQTIITQKLGGKAMKPGGLISEGITKAEKLRINSLNRGLIDSNR